MLNTIIFCSRRYSTRITHTLLDKLMSLMILVAGYKLSLSKQNKILYIYIYIYIKKRINKKLSG